MNQRPRIAVIGANSLMNIGLKSVIERIIPTVEVSCFASAEDVVAQPDGGFFHFFISAQVFADNRDYFTARCRQTIILTTSSQMPMPAAMHTLDVSQSEEDMVRDILRLHSSGHGREHDVRSVVGRAEAQLSSREREVLSLVVRGYINKEIADMLNISINTVISHRRNIVERLGMSSVSALTIYAVMHGIVDISDI